ncbi:MAG: alpha/beta fold hydrolase, partial [Candidatus Promineifilaceae bacterium]|nr:alpha/beta fold hydrolase [Candidatus Promineifilaceae bacterium]
NSLIFHYRGCWGSGGRYRFDTQPADIAAALDYLATRPRPQIDPQRLVLIGHSMGGWAAVLAGAADRRVRAVAVYGAVADPRTWTFNVEEAATEYTPWLQGVTPTDLVAQWKDLAEAFWPVAQVARLAPRPLLIIHGAADGVVPPEQGRSLYEAAGQPRQLVVTTDANHAFSWQRKILRETLLEWLAQLMR